MRVKVHHVVLIRSIVLILGAYIYGRKDGVDFSPSKFFKLSKEVRDSLLWRSIYGYGSIVTTLVAIQLLPVSIAVALMMSTVFVTAILAYLFAGESLNYSEVAAICGGFFGVLMLTNPTLFEHKLSLIHI